MISECLSAAAGSGVYVEQVIMEFRQKIDFELFSRAWIMLVQHHDFLRMGFAQSDSAGFDRLLVPIQELNIETLDWSHNTEQAAEEFLNAFIQADRRLGFSPFTPPLFRIALLKLASQRYICIFTFFAAIADEKTLGAFLNFLFSAYGNDVPHRPASVHTAPDASVKIQAPQASAAAFWRNHFENITQPLYLPFSFAKPRVKQDRRNRQDLSLTTQTYKGIIPPEQTMRLEAFCKKRQIPLKTLLTGAFAVALSHYSGENEIFFCIERDDVEKGAAPRLGNSMNILPAKFSIDPKDSVLNFLAHVQSSYRETDAFGCNTLDDIRSQIGVTAGTELFDIAFSYQEQCIEPVVQANMEKIGCQKFSILKRTPFSIFLSICGTTQLTVNFHFDRRRFDKPIISAMLGHLSTWLYRATGDEPPTLSNIPILSTEEKKKIALALNPTPMPPKPDSCLHHLFEIQASANRHLEAVSTPTDRMTFGQLNDSAGQIAHGLACLTAKPGARIVLLLESGPMLVSAQLGVLKAGCIVIPLSSDRSETDLKKDFDVLKPGLVITSPELGSSLPIPKEQIMVIERTGKKMETPSSMRPNVSVSPDSISYILGTMNGTQVPDWVMIAHNALVSYARSAIDIYDILPTDKILLTGAIGSTVFTAQIFLGLYSGAALALPPWTSSPSPATIMAYCKEHDVTILELSQRDWQQFINNKNALLLPDSLRLLIIDTPHGQAGQFEKWHTQLPQKVRTIATYGSAETTGPAFWMDLADTDAGAQSSMGNPFPGICICLLNQFGQPALHHTVGELIIGGVQVSRGYFQNAAKTRESFGKIDILGNPVYGFKTGDHARWIPETGLTLHKQTRARTTRDMKAPPPAYISCPEGETARYGQETPTIVLVGNSARAALSYKKADLKGYPFFHAPIFIHFYGADGQARTHLGIPEIAKKCIANVQEHHPNGPYILIGECQNAIVAHEMAIQFKEIGVEVSMLIIIDENWQAQSPASAPDAPQNFFLKQMGEIKNHGLGYIFSKIKKRLRYKWFDAYSSLDRVREKFYRLSGLPVPAAIQYRAMEEVYYRACEQHPYYPPLYEGQTLLLYSKEWKTRFDPQLNRYYTGTIRKISRPVQHSDWFKPEQIKFILEEIKDA